MLMLFNYVLLRHQYFFRSYLIEVLLLLLISGLWWLLIGSIRPRMISQRLMMLVLHLLRIVEILHFVSIVGIIRLPVRQKTSPFTACDHAGSSLINLVHWFTCGSCSSNQLLHVLEILVASLLCITESLMNQTMVMVSRVLEHMQILSFILVITTLVYWRLMAWLFMNLLILKCITVLVLRIIYLKTLDTINYRACLSRMTTSHLFAYLLVFLGIVWQKLTCVFHSLCYLLLLVSIRITARRPGDRWLWTELVDTLSTKTRHLLMGLSLSSLS